MHTPASLHLCPYKMILLSVLKLLMHTDFGSAWHNEKRCYSQRNFQICHSGLFLWLGCHTAYSSQSQEIAEVNRGGCLAVMDCEIYSFWEWNRKRGEGREEECVFRCLWQKATWGFNRLTPERLLSHVHPLHAFMGFVWNYSQTYFLTFKPRRKQWGVRAKGHEETQKQTSVSGRNQTLTYHARKNKFHYNRVKVKYVHCQGWCLAF